jgi:hypothetical protein
MQTRDALQYRLLLSGLFLLLSATALCQDTATLTGTVRDNSGPVIPGAVVAVKQMATGTVRQLATNSAGEYVAAALVPGQYDLTITASGFRTYQAQAVTLRVAQNARIDVTLQVGAATQQVTVQGEGLAQVDTESSQLGSTITGTEVVQLQLNGRNFTQLITLVPGVSNQTGQDEGVVGAEGSISYSVNGGRTEYNNWEVDGGDMMDNGSNFSLNVYPSVEAIEEVQVLTSNYGAQYGKNGSGTVEVETKSGSNQFHGSLWEFARNEAFNAHNYFDVPGTPKAGYKKHDFGYSVGGPIWKNHTFFFWLQNWRRENVPQNFYNFVPSVANRNGDFNDVCDAGSDCPFDPNTGDSFPNNQLPSIDPNSQILLNMIPEPNVGSGANSIFAAAIAYPVSTGNAYADLLMGNIASFSQASSQPKYHINFKIFEPYFQDDYHVSKNLTLNLGVRISFYGTFWERNHLISNWTPSAYVPANAPRLQINDTDEIPQGALIPGSGDPFDGMVQCGVNGIPRGCLKGHLFNPAPRLGFSWDPTGNGKMAVRGGYGIFFEHTNGLEANAEDLEGTPPIVQTPNQYNISGYANVGGQGLLFPLSTTSIPDRAVWPYVQQWHLDVQRDLFHNTIATLAYVGAKGTSSDPAARNESIACHS